MNLKNDSDADVRAFYGGSAKTYGSGQNMAGNTSLNDEDDVYAFKDEVDEEQKPFRDGAGEAGEAGKVIHACL